MFILLIINVLAYFFKLYRLCMPHNFTKTIICHFVFSLLFTVACIAAPLVALAQNGGYLSPVKPANTAFAALDYGLTVGANIGTPKNDGPTGDSRGWLGVTPRVGIFGQYNFNTRWSLEAELAYSRKASSFVSSFKDRKAASVTSHTYPNPFHAGDTTFYTNDTVPFSGTVHGRFDNTYIELPIQVRYRVGRELFVALGGYVAYLYKGVNDGTADGTLGVSSVAVSQAFDNAAYLNRWDFGGRLGIEAQLWRRIYWRANATYAKPATTRSP